MADRSTVRVTLRPLGEILGPIQRAVDQVLGFSAERTLERAENNVIDMGAIETGFLEASGYVRTPAGSTEAEARSRAAYLADHEFESSESGPTESGTVQVLFGASYSAHVHDGTKRMIARPFLLQAVLEEGPALMQNLREVFE